MPKTKRDLLKRQIAHALNNINLAGGHVSQVHDAFKSDHPDLAEGLHIVLVTLANSETVLRAFIKAAWGIDDFNIDANRNVPIKNKD